MRAWDAALESRCVPDAAASRDRTPDAAFVVLGAHLVSAVSLGLHVRNCRIVSAARLPSSVSRSFRARSRYFACPKPLLRAKNFAPIKKVASLSHLRYTWIMPDEVGFTYAKHAGRLTYVRQCLTHARRTGGGWG